MASTSPRKKSSPKSGGQKNRSSSVTFMVLVLIILLVTVLILAFQSPLANIIAGVAKPSSSPQASPSATSSGNKLVIDGGTPSPSPTSPSPSPSVSPSPGTTGSPSPSPVGPSPSVASPSPSPKGDLKTVTLYYAKVADSGKISLEPVERQIDFQDSPLTSSLRVLLQGPNGNELSSGLVSMIPAGTDLLSAWIRGNTAFLNFSESFQFNPLGPDGLRAQIAQVIYAATEFPTVKDVQILIDGKTIDYLGGDNVYVGKPISRKTLP